MLPARKKHTHTHTHPKTKKSRNVAEILRWLHDLFLWVLMLLYYHHLPHTISNLKFLQDCNLPITNSKAKTMTFIIKFPHISFCLASRVVLVSPLFPCRQEASCRESYNHNAPNAANSHRNGEAPFLANRPDEKPDLANT